MSDGPHRSLPLRRHWKKLAERAERPSYSAAEVAEAFSNAILKEFREAPLLQVQNILVGNRQGVLFHEDCVDRLEAVRSTCRGSTAGSILIDCAIEANINGLTGYLALRTALRNALKDHSWGTCLSIEEHYQRKEPQSMMNIRARLRSASSQVPYDVITTEMISQKADSKSKFRLTKRTGIDEGPPL